MNRTLRWLSLTLVTVLALAACSDPATSTLPAESAELELAANAGTPIPDRYIVVFRDDVRDVAAQTDALLRGRGATVHFRYTTALRGFAATLPEAAVAAIRNNPNVAYVEQDAVVTAIGTQDNATWGLDRIDQRVQTLDGTYTYGATGAGVTAYVIDTGILGEHVDFGGRVTQGYDAIGRRGSGSDCNGHGTHVAGTIGGATWGVAKDVSLVAVRVLDCRGSGTFSGVIAGIDWVTKNKVLPSVANMSLGGGKSDAVNKAVETSIAAGVVYAVAAGNETTDACTKSPASAGSALTVGATQDDDARAYYSNFGTCVDLFAPGSAITSAWHTSTTATNTISGTSMAAPHVAGAAALFLETNPIASPEAVATAVATALTSNATSGVVGDARTGSPNLLLYTGSGSDIAGPTAAFIFSCTDLTCGFDGSTSTDDVASYAWAFGDGATASGSTTSHTFKAANTYIVTLTVADGAGLKHATSQDVLVTSSDPGTVDTIKPTVTSSATNTSAGPWIRYDVSWRVTDDTALAVVTVEAFDGTRAVDTVATSVSGTEASGVTSVRSRGSISSLRVTVEDAAGNSTTQEIILAP